MEGFDIIGRFVVGILVIAIPIIFTVSIFKKWWVLAIILGLWLIVDLIMVIGLFLSI